MYFLIIPYMPLLFITVLWMLLMEESCLTGVGTIAVREINVNEKYSLANAGSLYPPASFYTLSSS